MTEDRKENSSFVRASGAFGKLVGKFRKKIIEPMSVEVAEVYDDVKKKFTPMASHFYENVMPEKIKNAEDIYDYLKKQHGSKVAGLFKKSIKPLPSKQGKEKVSTVVGGAPGAAIGFAIGGSIGVVGFFGGIGISLPLLLGVTLAFAGNRIGIGLDKAELEERRRSQDERYNELLEKYEEAEQRAEEPEPSVNVLRIHGAEAHADLLKKAMKNSKDSIIILCGWVTDYVVDEEFKELLKGALERGVNV